MRQSIIPNADFRHENAFGAVPFLRERVKRMRELAVEFGKRWDGILWRHGSRMQLLKAAAFVPDLKDAIMEGLRAAAGMRLAQGQKSRGEYIAYFDHPGPGCGHFIQIGFSAGAESNHFVNH